MRIKTNIYHFTADNGLNYGDFTGYAETVYARNEDEAVKKGVSILRGKLGPDAAIDNARADVVFENVEMEVLTPTPFRTTIDAVDFVFNYETNNLTIDGGFAMRPDSIQKLHNYLTNLLITLK